MAKKLIGPTNHLFTMPTLLVAVRSGEGQANIVTIAWAGVISAVAGILFFWRMLARPEPLVVLRAFTNANFAFGSLFSFVLASTRELQTSSTVSTSSGKSGLIRCGEIG